MVSTGDAGITNTIGSPSTDPKLISVGASTTFRAYQQEHRTAESTRRRRTRPTEPGSTTTSRASPRAASRSPGEHGRPRRTGRPELAALQPERGRVLHACTNENGAPSGIQITGGTSESAPITSAAAADVIQAYASTHHGTRPVTGSRQADPGEHGDRRRSTGRAAGRGPVERARGGPGGDDLSQPGRQAGRAAREPEPDQHPAGPARDREQGRAASPTRSTTPRRCISRRGRSPTRPEPDRLVLPQPEQRARSRAGRRRPTRSRSGAE